jgi:hypothetical protein
MESPSVLSVLHGELNHGVKNKASRTDGNFRDEG